jgi:hypothetical protein
MFSGERVLCVTIREAMGVEWRNLPEILRAMYWIVLAGRGTLVSCEEWRTWRYIQYIRIVQTVTTLYLPS